MMAKFSVVARFGGVIVRATKNGSLRGVKVTNYEVRLASWKKNAGEVVYSFGSFTDFIQYAKVRVAIEKTLITKYDSETETIYLEE